MEEKNAKCCITSCDRPLDQNYWNARWERQETRWDIGTVSQEIRQLIEMLSDKNCSILIPGCGNAYEAEYLIEKGFTNITLIDIAPLAVEHLKAKFDNNPEITVICEDLFQHSQKYDVIIEQTFFCALSPTLRPKYVWKMHQLLKPGGRLIGLLFNRQFEDGPPFGGSKEEYEQLFKDAFYWNHLDIAKGSIAPRFGMELSVDFRRNDSVFVKLYSFIGITCNGCLETVVNKFSEIEGVHNVQMNSDFSEVMIVSDYEVEITILQELVSYERNYKIETIG